MPHAPQYGLSRKKRTKQGLPPVRAQSALVIPVDEGQANCDIIRQRSLKGFIRLNTGFWRGAGNGLRATSAPVESHTIEAYRGAKRARHDVRDKLPAYTLGKSSKVSAPNIQAEPVTPMVAHGIFTPELNIKVTLHLWHKSAKQMGQGSIISKR